MLVGLTLSRLKLYAGTEGVLANADAPSVPRYFRRLQ